MKKSFLLFIVIALNLTVSAQKSESFTFALAADMRNFSGDNINYFRGACEAIAAIDKDIPFMISPGDIDPPDSVYYTIQKYISPQMVWYPVVGNHEAETKSDMEWMRAHNANGNSLPNIVNKGPESCKETNYSFDYQNTHFVILNEYSNETCDNCTNGEVNDMLYNWLESDLKSTTKKNLIVVGHEPAYPLPDIETQRFRHTDDCLNQYPVTRDRFVKLLQSHGVRAYIYGHTHNYIVAKMNNLWHIDVAHARGTADAGARSTFILMTVDGEKISFNTYRIINDTYTLADEGELN